MTEWFNIAFGFNESKKFETNRDKFLNMYNHEKNKSINSIDAGEFYLMDLNTMHGIMKKHSKNKKGKVNLHHIVEDITNIHLNKKYENSTIQVASQFNCLEMIDQTKTPQDGITNYIYDRTQGPICTLSTPAGLAYRNYIYLNGDTQIDTTKEPLQYLKSITEKNIGWNIVNGYMFFNDIDQLRNTHNILLELSIEQRNYFKNFIKVGIHNNLGVFDYTKKKQTNIVNHVYCSGIPISYNTNIPKDKHFLFSGLSELFLEAIYELTLLSACYNNIVNNTNKQCFLTYIGGGVFGMDIKQIYRAIEKSCDNVEKYGFDLDVIIVDYKKLQTKPSFDKRSIFEKK